MISRDDEHQYTEWSRLFSNARFPSGTNLEVDRSSSKSCVSRTRSHPFIYVYTRLIQASLVQPGCRESIDGCRMLVKFGDAVLLDLISSSFFILLE